jgi:hypothetical protein
VASEQAPPAPGSAREEAERILRLVGGDALKAYEMLERQMATLALRTQVMLSLSGIVITVTGFSVRAIAETSALARLSISAGIFVVLAAAAVAIGGVLRLKWLSQQIAPDPLTMLVRAIEVRDKKARFLAAALALFVVGFAFYCVAIAQLILHARPE